MITRKAILVAFTLCATETGAHGQGPAPPNPGMTAEQAAAFRQNAATWDQAKNAYSNLQPLSKAPRTVLQGVAEKLTDAGADQAAEAITGVDPKRAVSDLADKIIKTDKLYNDMADWRTANRGQQPPNDIPATSPIPSTEQKDREALERFKTPNSSLCRTSQLLCRQVGVDVVCSINVLDASVPSGNRSLGVVRVDCQWRNKQPIPVSVARIGTVAEYKGPGRASDIRVGNTITSRFMGDRYESYCQPCDRELVDCRTSFWSPYCLDR
jgi:hypothetical protein